MANLEPFWDFAHGINNDFWNTIDVSGLGPHMRVMFSVYNLPYAAWDKGEIFV